MPESSSSSEEGNPPNDACNQPPGLLFLVIIVRLETGEVIFQEDGFKSQELQDHCRLILSRRRSTPSPSTPGAAIATTPVPTPLVLQSCSPEPIHFTLGVDYDFFFLVAVPSPDLGWALITEIHKLWSSSSSPTGSLGSELRGLRHRHLEPIEPPTGTGVHFPFSVKPPAATTNATEEGPSVAVHKLRPVKPDDIANIYFSASLFHEARRFRQRLDEIRLRSRINKAVAFFALCIILLLLSIVLTCSKGGSLNLSKCFYG